MFSRAHGVARAARRARRRVEAEISGIERGICEGGEASKDALARSMSFNIILIMRNFAAAHGLDSGDLQWRHLSARTKCARRVPAYT
jgi:hypothetical protein